MILNNGGTLRVYSSADQWHRLKSYAYGHPAPICIMRNQIPPFQVVYPLDVATVNAVTLVRVETGAETDIFAAMLAAGLKTVTFPLYKILKWRASNLIPGPLMAEGLYYIKIGNGVYEWVSEEFSMKADVSKLWKIEYCHGENFPLPDIGHIDYTEGYRNYFLVHTEIGKPTYGFEEEVKRRDGQNFPLQQIRFKSHRFELILPEETIDAMSLIPLHDEVVISRGEVTHEVDEITVNAEWLEQGDLATCELEFRTDSVVVVNGRGIESDIVCGVEAGDCYEINLETNDFLEVLALVVEGSADWDNHQYTTPGGAIVPLEFGDLIISEDTSATPSTFEVQFDNSAFYSAVPQAAGTYIFEANTGRYFFQNGPAATDIITNRIIDVDGSDVTYQAVPISIVQLYALLATGGEVLLGVYLPSFAEETQTVVMPDSAVAVRMVASTAACPAVYEGPWLYFDPLELVSCAGDYESDAAALADGVPAGGLYCLTIDNIYGMPQGVVKRLEPYTGYPSDAAALLILGPNVIFSVSTANDIGVPGGVLRINVDGSTTYADDAAAATGGVLVGEFYIWDCSDAGYPAYLIKKRLA